MGLTDWSLKLEDLFGMTPPLQPSMDSTMRVHPCLIRELRRLTVQEGDGKY